MIIPFFGYIHSEWLRNHEGVKNPPEDTFGGIFDAWKTGSGD